MLFKTNNLEATLCSKPIEYVILNLILSILLPEKVKNMVCSLWDLVTTVFQTDTGKLKKVAKQICFNTKILY